MIQGSVSKSWLNREGEFTFPEKYYFDPEWRYEQDRKIAGFLDTRFPDYPIYNMESNLVQADCATPEMMLVGGIQPNLIIGAALGAEFVFPEGNDGDIRGKPLDGISAKDDLPPMERIVQSDLVRLLDDQIQTMAGRYPHRSVVPPFFWDLSGRASIHGFITTSYKLVGENIYILLFENPKFVGEIHEWIFNVYTALIDHFSSLAGLSVTGLHIGECSGAMMSPDDFITFILPYANRMGTVYGNVRFHSCGTSNHLLQPIKKINGLASLDTGSDTSVSLARSVFGRETLIEMAPPAELMMAEAEWDDLARWLEGVLRDNDDGPLKLGYHFEYGYSLDNILHLHDELCRMGHADPGRKKI